MKKLIYKVEGYIAKENPETSKVERRLSLATVTIENPSVEEIERAAEIAYCGEYAIEDDGQAEHEAMPTDAERIADLEEALALLLSGETE